MRRIAAVAAVVAALAFPAHAEVSKWNVDVKMADGAKLRATIYSQGRRVPGLLLLHQCNSDRRSWDALATSLAKAGLSVMTMDFRGYGESAGAGTPREKMAELQAKWPSDVETAWAF
ncbi:MAG TPA: hypothetical protein VNI57_06810, partial [Candidatus Saccharimonadales bacterium]|nr:hypothetical protein [Candidatus Saccharimonadales bacterium]